MNLALRFSLAAIVISLGSPPMSGGIVIQPNEPCFVDEVNAVLDELHATDGTFAAEIDYLRASTDTYVISRVRGDAFSTGENYTAPNGVAHGSFIGWDPDIGSPYASWGWTISELAGTGRYDDNLPIDAVAALAHELRHAYEQARGTIDHTEDPTQNYIERSELRAVEAENRYRTAKGMCLRTHYGIAVIPEFPTPGTGPCSRAQLALTPLPTKVSRCRSAQQVGNCEIYATVAFGPSPNFPVTGTACIFPCPRQECSDRFARVEGAWPNVHFESAFRSYVPALWTTQHCNLPK